MHILKCIIVLVVSAAGAFTDYREYKIKNGLTVPTAVLGLVLVPLDKSLTLFEAVLGLLLPFILCLVFYAARMLKAGDVKLFMCLGAVMGWKWILNCMAASIIAGGTAALIICIKRGILKERFKRLFEYFKSIFYSRTFTYYAEAENGKFPFGVSIFIGTAVIVLLDGFGFYLFLK
ncbi:MAG: A24 family peptidase [Clostridiales bacterium]|nr:A24 family peptidase [Clostridiales bacterium]